jgi:ketosteroid isomerase-like protein
MIADSKTHSEVVSVLKGMFEAYKKRDLQGMLACMASDPDVVVIGSGEDERAIGPAEFGKSASRDWAQSESASVAFKDAHASMAGSVAWFDADVAFQFTIAKEKTNLPGRLTGVLEKKSGKWLIMQLHFSLPACEQEHGHSWPEQGK